jgi:outer membrane protein OmpA-like peptidoglycan-associated protein
MRVWAVCVGLLIATRGIAGQQKPEFTAAALAVTLHDQGTVALHQIQFDPGKAVITPESVPSLASIGELLQSDATLNIEIRVHTDNFGTPAANLRLSRDRAAAVKSYLVENLGIAPLRLTTAGLGDTKPIASNATADGRAENRRIELVKK